MILQIMPIGPPPTPTPPPSTPPPTASRTPIEDILFEFAFVLERAFPVIISLAILFFLWGLTRYILKTDDVEGRKGARSMMTWGVIIIFVMVSLWGLVNFLDGLFGLDDIPPGFPELRP